MQDLITKIDQKVAQLTQLISSCNSIEINKIPEDSRQLLYFRRDTYSNHRNQLIKYKHMIKCSSYSISESQQLDILKCINKGEYDI